MCEKRVTVKLVICGQFNHLKSLTTNILTKVALVVFQNKLYSVQNTHLIQL